MNCMNMHEPFLAFFVLANITKHSAAKINALRTASAAQEKLHSVKRQSPNSLCKKDPRVLEGPSDAQCHQTKKEGGPSKPREPSEPRRPRLMKEINEVVCGQSHRPQPYLCRVFFKPVHNLSTLELC